MLLWSVKDGIIISLSCLLTLQKGGKKEEANGVVSVPADAMLAYHDASCCPIGQKFLPLILGFRHALLPITCFEVLF